ncbi:hypothetical protein QF049_000979 [Paenibacillus sp. W4I10]|nr:hypothetical protein [Paenibacillus sp. W4I10]
MTDNMASYSLLGLAGLITTCLFIFGIACLVALFINVFRLLKGRFNRKLEQCQSCVNTISISAIICPNCGHHYGRSNGVFNSIFGSFVGFVIFICGGFIALAELIKMINDK